MKAVLIALRSPSQAVGGLDCTKHLRQAPRKVRRTWRSARTRLSGMYANGSAIRLRADM